MKKVILLFCLGSTFTIQPMQQNSILIARSVDNKQEKKESFICPIDAVQTTTISAFTNHLKREHIENIPKGAMLTCSLCIANRITKKEIAPNSSGKIDWNALPEKIKFRTNHLLNVHKKEQHEETYRSVISKKRKISPTDVQGKENPYYANLVEEMIATHANQAPTLAELVCELCSETFTQIRAWNNHFKEHVIVPSKEEGMNKFCALCAHDELYVMCVSGSLPKEKVNITTLQNTFRTNGGGSMREHYKTHNPQEGRNQAVFLQLLAEK
ncbi:MAG: hypothetical protein WCE21_02065 [Candidatus Babeliales bacterium]